MSGRRLDPAAAERLAKVLGRLGTTFDGERAAAGLLADRIVRGAGLSWQDLLGVVDATTTSLRSPSRPRAMGVRAGFPSSPSATASSWRPWRIGGASRRSSSCGGCTAWRSARGRRHERPRRQRHRPARPRRAARPAAADQGVPHRHERPRQRVALRQRQVLLGGSGPGGGHPPPAPAPARHRRRPARLRHPRRAGGRRRLGRGCGA